MRGTALGEVVQEDVLQLLGAERQAGDLRVALHVDEVFAAQQQGELAQVHLGDQHAPVAAQHVAEVGRQRVEVAQVRRGDLVAQLAHPAGTGADRPVGRAPAEHQQVGVAGRVVDLDVRARGCRRSSPRAAGPSGRGCRGRRRSTRGRPPSPAADAVLEPRRAGHRPRPGQGVVVAQVGPELGAVRRVRGGGERRVGVRQRVDVRHQPRLGAVGDRAVGQQEHRRPVGHRDPDGLQRGVEAVAGRTRRDDRQRRLAVAAEHRLQQVGLLGLGGQARRRPAALHVDHQQRQLERHRQPDRLALQRDPGPGRRRHAQRAAERRTQRRTDAGDLVLGLERGHAEGLVLAQLVQDVRRRA